MYIQLLFHTLKAFFCLSLLIVYFLDCCTQSDRLPTQWRSTAAAIVGSDGGSPTSGPGVFNAPCIDIRVHGRGSLSEPADRRTLFTG